MIETQSAEHIVWDAPGGVQMSLVPETGGSLQVSVKEGAITVSGKQCRHLHGDDVAHQVLAEVRLTIISTRCQITWKSSVTTESN